MMPLRREPLFVYFVEAENGMIKIGSSTMPEERARQICANSPVKVRLIISIPGTRADESFYHERFSESRAWNEWFFQTGRLASFIAGNRGTGVAEILEWEQIKWPRDPDEVAASQQKRADSMRAAWRKPGAREDWFKFRRKRAASGSGAAA